MAEADKPKKQSYIYESPDKGETVFRRPFGDFDSPREMIMKNGEWLEGTKPSVSDDADVLYIEDFLNEGC